jgi:hypothetical protein
MKLTPKKLTINTLEKNIYYDDISNGKGMFDISNLVSVFLTPPSNVRYANGALISRRELILRFPIDEITLILHKEEVIRDKTIELYFTDQQALDFVNELMNYLTKKRADEMLVHIKKERWGIIKLLRGLLP